jgi:hypothetical protein
VWFIFTPVFRALFTVQVVDRSFLSGRSQQEMEGLAQHDCLYLVTCKLARVFTILYTEKIFRQVSFPEDPGDN